MIDQDVPSALGRLEGKSEAQSAQTSKDARVNLWATILGPIFIVLVIGPLIAWAVWSVNAKFAMEAALNSQKFVTVERFEKSHAEIMAKIDAANVKIDGVKEDIGEIKTGVAVLSAQNQNTIKTTR